MFTKKIFFLLSLLSLCILCNPVISEDLPPITIGADSFPFEQGQAVVMQKQLWGERDEISFETSVVGGTKDVQGKQAFIVKSIDTSGDVQEDYMSKDGSGLMYLGTTREKWNKLVPALNLKFPLQLNATWTAVDREISGKHVLITAKVTSQEFIKVPAGIFQCLKIDITSGFTDEKRVVNSSIWIAPGKGIVKEIQQIEEKVTQVRELVYFQKGGKSLAGASLPSGGSQWSGNGESTYHAYSKHPTKGSTIEQDIVVSYGFTFSIDPGTGFIKGQGEASIKNYKNSSDEGGKWTNYSVDGAPRAAFTFTGKKEGNSLNFYDGFTSINPEKIKLSGVGDVPLMKALEHAFRLSASVNGNSAGASFSAGTKDGASIKIQWQAKQ